MKLLLIFSMILLTPPVSIQADAAEGLPIVLYFGFITQVHCSGKLYLSSVGNPKLVTREAFPKELGCGVLVQPIASAGHTDLLLKTSVGDAHRILEIRAPSNPPTSQQLEIWLDLDQPQGERS